MMDARAHVTFHGKVQGVFFRANTRDRARAAGLAGWVRNLADGTVEAVFEGDRPSVEVVIEWCSKSQPHARVTDVDVRWEEATGEFTGFDVRY